ncbi:MAG: hypothetical protein IPK90_09040 [Chitinophagaceae bacterium]|nr:hypothetical protein [Chitinophagaceae bacterium]
MRKRCKKIEPYVGKINQFFASYQSLSNDQLRNKTQEFRQRIKEHLSEIDAEIAAKILLQKSFRLMTSWARILSTRK